MKPFPPVLALGALAVAMLGCTGRDTTVRSSPAAKSVATAGSRAADFTAHDLDGKNIQLSSLLGKNVVLLSFSMTFCDPCVAEFPHLRRMYAANKEKGFVILGIAMDGPETVANVPAFVRRNQLNFPVIMDEDSRISLLYNPTKAAPLSVLIDRYGKIAMVRSGYTAGDEQLLGEEVAKVLAEPGASH